MSEAISTVQPRVLHPPRTAPASVAGTTTFVHLVVEKIAGIAAREVPGVYKLGGGVIRDAVARVSGTLTTSHGVSAEVGLKEIAVDLELVAEYGPKLHEIAAQVRRQVSRRLEAMTGLSVKEVNIDVTEIHYAPEAPPNPRVQ